jgi:heterodisulfide reductase subunit C
VLINELNKITEQDLNLCYQCQKCTATCPVSEYMDIKPDVMVKKVMLGGEDELLKSKTIWICTGCETCGSRCPNLISVGAINEFLRERSVKKGVEPSVKAALAIHKAFLGSIRRFGVIHEASMLAEFKIRTKDFFSDIGLGLKMFLKGKIPLKIHRIKGIDELRNIMRDRE